MAFESAAAKSGCRSRRDGSGRTNEQERYPFGVKREMLDESQHRLVGPMQIFEHEHGRALPRGVLEEAPPRAEQLIPLRGRACLNPQQRKQPLSKPLALRALGKRCVQLIRRGLRRVGVEHARVGLEDLAKCPERDPVPVGQTVPPANPNELRPSIDMSDQLGHHSALPEPRFSDNRHQLHRARREGPFEHPFQQRKFDLATDERALVRPRQLGDRSRPRGLRVEHAHRLGLAPQRGRLRAPRTRRRPWSTRTSAVRPRTPPTGAID